LLSATEIVRKYWVLRQYYAHRDQTMNDVYNIRHGDVDVVFPDMVSEAWPKQVTSNFIDIAARDLSELLAPLPSFNCAGSTMVSQRAREFHDKRTKIVHGYMLHSNAALQSYTSADQYVSYGFRVAYIEPDYKARMPRIVWEDPMGGYPEYDRWGRVKSYTRRVMKRAWELIAEYPEFADIIIGPDRQRGAESMVELIRYCDADQITLLLTDRGQGIKLRTVPNVLGRTPVVIDRRPGLSDRSRGQWDDVMWVQLARDRMSKLAIEAAEKSIQAPLALPPDVLDMPYGPDAIIRTQFPEKVRRVGLELPQAAFAESQMLAKELRDGSRYPEGRTGNMDASIITGRGVQELMGGFDTQVKAAQMTFGVGFREIIKMCFEMDEKLWPNVDKTVNGVANGTPFSIAYRPARDINGDHTCDVTYGFAAGMDPNRALVFLLQLLGAKAISRDMVMRQMPFEFDVSQEQIRIDVEEAREAAKQTLFGYAQSLPAVAAQGGDPTEIISKITTAIQAMQKGKAVEEALAEAFAQPKTPPPGALTPGAPPTPPGPGSASAPGGGQPPSPLPPGVAPGQAEMGPGGRPDLQSLLAGLSSSGQPVLAQRVQRRIPA
jgi:hypothetical protein